MHLSYSSWPTAATAPIHFVVVMARHQQQWLLCRHQQRDTWDIPGGKIEADETPLQAAARELQEETGARQFRLDPIELYHVDQHGQRQSGLLCIAEVSELGPLPAHSEMAAVKHVSHAPAARHFAHPSIQPQLFAQVCQWVELQQQLSRYQHVIWDWNGTLVDDAPLAVTLVNQMLQQRQLPLTDLNQYRDQFCHPVVAYYQHLGFAVDDAGFDWICSQFGQGYQARRHQLHLHPGCGFLLTQLKRQATQSILSASAQHSLEQCLEHHGIAHHFDHVYGLDNHHAHSKLARGQALLQHSTVAASNTILIGDTDHDLEVATALGIDCLLVAAGHQSLSKLRALHHQVLPSWQLNSVSLAKEQPGGAL
ncbi:HAD hydrolase-like protein [uncultured Ferrimonas sp.]|uniref:HAD hydrolase-like protein n=1 Tax=uncultured Ferrimonas sp. TaxID=432640 RepID=UPI002637BCC0|nr:HAD hydrolase-like protein [uncultured Ferrimonas sp.]